MISGNNSIINNAGTAKTLTEIADEKEILQQATLVAMSKSKYVEVEKEYLDDELNKYSEVDSTEEVDNGIQVTFKSGREYLVDTDGNVNEVIIADRTGISVGDYITYTSPTASVTFTGADTGYSTYATTPATLTAKTLFRVMDIDSHGNMTLIGAMTSSDPTIYFSGAVGYNNAVYTLNKKCSDLYKDTSKGITARSIKVEDITDRMIEGTKGDTTATSTGRKKLEKYQDEKVAALTTGTYITATDTTKNTVTYQTNTYYPDIFQYEAGGLLGTTATTGVIGQSESYSGYGGLTTNGVEVTSSTKPANLTVPYTYYSVTPAVSDFDNTKGNASAYQNMFFGTNAYYWLASRFISCYSDHASFGLRYVYRSIFIANSLYDSAQGGYSRSNHVCPVVYLPSSVQVTVSTDTSTYHQTVPHVVQ